MNFIFSFFLILTSFLTLDTSTSIVLSDQNDPYLKTSFNRESEIEQMLSNEANRAFMDAFEEKFKANFDVNTRYDDLLKVGVDDWEMELFDQRNQQMSFLKSASNLSPEFNSFIETEIKYNYWHLLLAYSINRSNKSQNLHTVTSLPRVMTDALNKEETNNEDLLISKSYRAFLPYFVIYFNSQDQRFEKYANGNKSLADKGNYASEKLNGNVLDYTLCQLIDLSAFNINTASFRYWTSQIFSESLQKHLTDKLYSGIVEREEKKEIAAKEKSKKGSLPNLVDLADKSFTFEKYKGKVIYVDFWASWCGPCRKEFPFSREMHESLSSKEKKDIVFLYISTDQDLEAWKKAVEKLGLEEFGENAHSFEVGRVYQISSIPRYMIINKKGEIVEKNATRPSNPETLKTLLELL